ncbi:glycine zipper 2TM domain-containing protein [Sphingomonas sp. Leaf339]|uniref:glycine zipper 2TM domain-containing protein n=1 Tax=Sphingomonas sp. Leaf339 TaxID=1736343 RepID=UPI000A7DDEA2|nr:glycine zipper 2TM domain-containing protein [Sphingomonas sp. Leaf339]
MRKFVLGAALLASAAAGMMPSVAGAQRYQDPRYQDRYEQRYQDDDGRYDPAPRYIAHRNDRRYDDRRGYDDRRRYDDRRDYGDRGYDRPQRCNKGTTGALVGAIAGGLLGRTIDSRGDRALGTILGGGAGALAGHAVEKSNNPGYCR